MPDSPPIGLVTGCDPPAAPGTIRLPAATTTLKERRVLVKAGTKSRVLVVDYRGDGGDGACVSATDHRALGQADTMTYRPLKVFEALRRDSGLRNAAFTAIVTFISTLIAAYLAYDKATATDPTTNVGPTETELIIAGVVALLACILAVQKFRTDWNPT